MFAILFSFVLLAFDQQGFTPVKLPIPSASAQYILRLNKVGEVLAAGCLNQVVASFFANCTLYFWSPHTGLRVVLNATETTSTNYFLNDRGEVAGTFSEDPFSGVRSVFMWSVASGRRQIGKPGELVAPDVRALNNKGEVAGTALLSSQPYTFLASLEDGVRIIDPSGSIPVGLSDAGEVAMGAQFNSVGGPLRALYWSSKTGMIDLGEQVGAAQSWSIAITGKGLLLFRARGGDISDKLFVWDVQHGVRYHQADSCRGPDPIDFNDSAEILTRCVSQFSGPHAGIVYARTGNAVDFGTLGAGATSYDLNKDGEAVGVSGLRSGPPHGFYWSSATGIVDLDPGSTRESSANVINDRGQIGGTINGQAYLWQRRD